VKWSYDCRFCYRLVLLIVKCCLIKLRRMQYFFYQPVRVMGLLLAAPYASSFFLSLTVIILFICFGGCARAFYAFSTGPVFIQVLPLMLFRTTGIEKYLKQHSFTPELVSATPCIRNLITYHHETCIIKTSGTAVPVLLFR
jgi:hypothetical protein